MILATLILGATIANLNMSVANVALPTIDRDLDATQPKLDLVAVGFTLGLAASVLYLGALADRHGRRRMLLFGLLLSIQIQDSFGGAADVAKTLPDAAAQKLMHAAEQAFTQGSHLAVAVALVIAVSASSSSSSRSRARRRRTSWRPATPSKTPQVPRPAPEPGGANGAGEARVLLLE